MGVGFSSVLVTVMLNESSLAEAEPSLTVIVMSGYTPASLNPGVPVIVPLLLLKLAQSGRLTMLKLRLSPSGSLAAGVNEYRLPSATLRVGDPLMVGAVLT